MCGVGVCVYVCAPFVAPSLVSRFSSPVSRLVSSFGLFVLSSSSFVVFLLRFVRYRACELRVRFLVAFVCRSRLRCRWNRLISPASL